MDENHLFKCCNCKNYKYINDFCKDNTVSRGVKYRCKECENMKRREWRINNLEESREKIRKQAERRRLNIKNRIRLNLGTRLYLAVNKKHGNTMELTGCSKEHLFSYLESKFEKGMSWENYGLWHIDHIIPCASFNLEDPNEQKNAFIGRIFSPYGLLII